MKASATFSLHPEHLADLRRSGLDDETIAAAGIRSLAPAEFPRYLSPGLAPKTESCYLIPYPDADGFYRVKLFPAVQDGDGHHIRYYQPAGTTPRLYVPSLARAALTDPSVPLLVTEGEKKALKGDQEDFACIAIGGLWNWLFAGNPVSDLDRADWYERKVLLVPDSDVWTRPDLLNAVYALGKELEVRGGKPNVVKFPTGAGGKKVGLDDYLCGHSVAQFEAVPKLDLKHPVFSKAAEWWKGWKKRKDDATKTRAGVLELLERGETVQHVHPAQDLVGGTLYYGLQIDQDLVVITSKREAFRADQLPAGLKLRHADPGPSSVSRDVALQWLTEGTQGSVAHALDELADFCSRYVVFRDQRDPPFLAAWTLGTYCYRAYKVFPYLHLRSATRRCGKTRVLKLLSRVAFNAAPVTTIPTEAQLYRAAARTSGTQLFDEMDKLRGDQERFEAVISVLNVGFEAGGAVTRLEKRGEKFIEIAYEVYAPRALAGLTRLKDTLEDRVLPLFMLRKRRNEPVARFTRAVDAEAQALRAKCALACLAHVGDILTGYDAAQGVLEREAIDDRAVDLWAPLVALTLVADAEDGGERTVRLLSLARDLAAGLRDDEAETGTTARLIEALEGVRQERGETLTPTELLNALRTRSGWDWMKSTRALATLLNPLGLFSGFRRSGDRKGRFFVLDPQTLADLKGRFTSAADAKEEAE